MTDVKVEQCDRDAAGELARFLGESEDHIGRIITGELDHTDIVQAFARHRQAAEKAQQERDAGIVEGKMAMYQAKIDAPGPYDDDLGLVEMRQHTVEALEVIATAIRSQGHE